MTIFFIVYAVYRETTIENIEFPGKHIRKSHSYFIKSCTMAKFLFRWGIKHPVIKHTGSSQLGTLNKIFSNFCQKLLIGWGREWGWDGMQLDRI